MQTTKTDFALSQPFQAISGVEDVRETPLENFTKPMHGYMHLEQPDALSVAWLAQYALRCRENPNLLETIRSELELVLQKQYSDEDLSRLWLRHAPGYTFERSELRHFLHEAFAAFETAKLSMRIPMPGKYLPY